MFRSIIMAFSMYSRIPMPKVDWNEKSMKYILCFFPFVGAVTGILSIICLWGCKKMGIGTIFTSAVLTILPLLVNGGIHMDGFLDTIDAKSSYKSKEERLEILKDPNTGAFAVIYGIVYILLSFGLFSEITRQGMIFMAVGYFFSRALSGFSVVTFQKARKEGMAASTAESANKKVKWIILLEICLCGILFLLLQPVMGSLCILSGILVFLYYKNMAYKLFGGVTGDLAGYFLQCCELMILLVVVLFGKLVL